MTISCDRSLVHFDWWIFDLGITWGWPAALMRSHLPLLGARSAAATVQLQSMSPGEWLMSITKQKDKKQMRLVCRNRDWNRASGPLDWAPCCCSMRSHSGLQKGYLHCCSKQGHPRVREDDGGDSFLWAVILGDYKDSQVVTKYLLYYISLGLFRPVSVLIPKSHGFTTQENCSPTFLEDTTAVTYKWRKNSLDSKISCQVSGSTRNPIPEVTHL